MQRVREFKGLEHMICIAGVLGSVPSITQASSIKPEIASEHYWTYPPPKVFSQ